MCFGKAMKFAIGTPVFCLDNHIYPCYQWLPHWTGYITEQISIILDSERLNIYRVSYEVDEMEVSLLFPETYLIRD